MKKSISAGLASVLLSYSLSFASLDSKISEGVNYYKIGNYEKALSSFEEVLKTDPTNSVALSNLGFIHYKLGNISKAKEYLTKSISYIKDRELIAVTYYVLADIEKKGGNEDGYIKNLKLSLQYNPEFKDAINDILNHYYSKGNFEEIVNLNISSKRLSESQQLILAQAHLKLNNKQEAKSILEKLKFSKDNQISSKAYQLLSSIVEDTTPQKETPQKTVKTTFQPQKTEFKQLQNISKEKPVKTISEIDKPLSRTVLTTEPEKELLSLIDINPTAESFNRLGLLQLKQGKIEEAKTSFMNALKIDPLNTDALNNLGILYLNLKDYDKAIKYFSESVKRDPYFSEAYYNLGNVYYKLGEIYKNNGYFNQAIENYKKVISLSPGNKSVLYNIANSYFMLEDYKTAIDYFKRAGMADEKVRKNLSLSYYNLALQEENKDEAIKYLKESIYYDASLKEANFLLGRLLYEKGDYREAKDYLLKAYQQYPERDKAEVVYFLGLAYSFSNDKDRAISYYKELRGMNQELAEKLFETIFQ